MRDERSEWKEEHAFETCKTDRARDKSLPQNNLVLCHIR